MPKRSELTISRRTVDGLTVEGKEAVFWDRELPGFGVRVYPSGTKKYVAQSRGPAGIRRVSLGRHGETTAEEARKKAAAAIARIKEGGKPATEPPEREPTVAELAKRYLEAHAAVHCNAQTQSMYEGVLRKHILPTLGAKPLSAVSRADVAALHYGLREMPRTANRALMVLSKIFSLSEAWGVAPQGGNPCRYVLRYKEGHRERFLTEEEYRRVGQALCELEAESPIRARAAAALRLLMLTGCRRSEVLSLRWSDVDRKTGELRLRDTKRGARMVPLTAAGLQVLSGISRVRRSPWVFTGKRPDRHLMDLTKFWHRVCKRADVEDVRIHDLRHSFASRALALGLTLPMIGRLLGHTDIGSTARYAHLSRDAEKVAAARVGGSIEADIVRAESEAHADGQAAAAEPSGDDGGNGGSPEAMAQA